MKNREIGVAFYDLRITSKTRAVGITEPNCGNISDILHATHRHVAKLKPTFKRGDSVLLQVMDWKIDKRRNEHYLLVNLADRDRPDIALTDFETRSTRFAGKKKLEGIDTSTHIVVKPNEDEKSALLLVTQGGGIGLLLAERLFNATTATLKRGGKEPALFSFPHPSGESDKRYNVSYTFECHGHKGQTLSRDLAEGSFVDMDLVTHEATGFDTGGNFQVRSRSLHIVPSDSSLVTVGLLKNALRSVLAPNVDAFDTARIRFKDHSGKTRIESFHINELDRAFVKREYITFDSDLQSNYNRLNFEIISKIREVGKL